MMANKVTSADGGWRVLFASVAQWPAAAEFLRWASEHFSRTPVKYKWKYENYRAVPFARQRSLMFRTD